MATGGDRVMPGALGGALAVLLGVVALVLWTGRDYVAGQFASSYSVSIRLETPTIGDKDRLERAFAAVRPKAPIDAKLEASSSSHFSSAEVRALSRAQALQAVQPFARALAAAFDAAGKGQLETDVHKRAYPVSDSTTDMVKKLATFGAPVLGLLAVFLFRRAWRQRIAVGDFKVPRGAGLAVTAALLLPVAMIVLPR